MGRNLIATITVVLASLALTAGSAHALALPATDLATEPPVGSCWSLTDDQTYSDQLPDNAQVDCGSPHTVEVAGLVEVPGRLRAKFRTAAIVLYAAKACRPVVNSYVGLTGEAANLSPEQFAGYSASQTTWFFPPPTAWRDDPWIACTALSLDDQGRIAQSRVGSVAGASSELTPVTATFEGASYTRMAVVELGGSPAKRWPGARKLQKTVTGKCRVVLGFDPPWVGWPNKASWRAGIRQGGCWVIW